MKNMFTYFFGILMLCCLVSTSNAQPDTDSPVVLEFGIEFLETESSDSVDAVFTLTFNEDVELSDNPILQTRVFTSGAWANYDSYDDMDVSLEDNVMIITPGRSFWVSGRYELVVALGAVTDGFNNLSEAFTRTFVADEDAPEVADLEIELTENAAGDSVIAVFTVTYSENIQLNNNFIISSHVNEEGEWPEYDVYGQDAVSVQGNILTITPERQFAMNQRYELIIAWGAVSDLAGNWATSFTRVFKPDVTSPEVVDFVAELEDTEHPDSLHVSLVITYNEEVKLPGSHTIVTHVRNAGVWEEYEVLTDSLINVSGNRVTINPRRLYATTSSYELVVSAGSVRDLVDNLAGAYTNVFLRDSIPPKLTGLSPDLATLVAPDASFLFTFDEPVRLSPNFGFYTYYYDNDSSKFIELERLTASQATVDGNVVTFSPGLSLRPATRSQIILTAGSVLDNQGNPFMNVLGEDTTTYLSERFWTADSGVTVITFLPGNGDTLTTIPDNLVISFSEQIMLADTGALDSLSLTTHVYLRSGSDDLEHVAEYDSTMHSIIITPADRLMWGSSYTFGFTEGFLNESMDSIAASEATFAIIDSVSVIQDATVAEVNGDGDVSPMLGQVVRVTGTVTGIYEGEGFFLQDANEVNSGIWVDESETSGLSIGDGVVVTGMVDVVDAVTAVIADEVSASEDTLVIEPLEYAFGTDSAQIYQGVLVHVSNGFVESGAVSGEWILYSEDGVDSLIISSRMHAFTPDDISNYSVTGIVTGWNGDYRLEPRNQEDIQADTDDLLTIAEVHGDTLISPYLGQVVQIAGTVTAVYADEGFFVQDENAARGGIWVEYSDTLQLEVGDGVAVTGMVEEVNGSTSIVADEVSRTSASFMVEPIVINFGTDSIPMYQGVVVKISNARGTAANIDGDWSLFANEDADSVIIGSRLYAYTPVADNQYDLTGVVTFRDNVFRIEPRMEADVVDLSDPTSVDLFPEATFRIYPNPFSNVIRISNHDRLTRIVVSNIAGQRVIDVRNPNAEINTSHLISGVYIINMFQKDALVKTSRIVKQ